MSLWRELKRRNVFKVGAAYAIVAWLLVQIIVAIKVPLGLPGWFDTAVIVLIATGFPVALLLAWAYEVTPEGIKLTQDVALDDSITNKTGRKLNVIVIGLLVAAVGYFIVHDYFFGDDEDVLANSIAVLPLENLGSDPAHDFFAPGIHDTIIGELAKVGGLNVISRTSVLRYADGTTPIPQIARELGVETIMEGSVQFADGRVLVTVQLIDPKTDAHLWTGDYNMEFKDIFLIEADIAKKIAKALEVELLPADVARIDNPLTDSADAFEWYLKERSLPFWEEYPDTIPTHVGYLDEAIALDPDFAAAYAWRSMARGALPKNGAEAKADAEKAAALDPSLGLAHMALAWAESDERDFSAARRSYEDAYRASPKNTRILVEYARFLARFGEQARGERLAEQAVELAPNGYAEYILYGQVLALRGDLSGALAQFQRAAAIAPAFAGSFSQIAVTQLALGHKAAARENIERAQALWSAPPSWALASLAYVYGRLGEQAKAEKFAQALDAMAAAGEQRVELEHELETALGLGDRERVRRLLTEMVETCPDACNVEPGYLRRFKINWLNDPMLTEPEFAELRSRMPVH